MSTGLQHVRAEKPFLHDKFSLGGGAVGADAVFDGDDAGLVLAERGIDDARFRGDVAVDDGQIFLLHGAGFPDFAQFAGSLRIFGDEHQSGGFAVQAVDQMWLLVGRTSTRQSCWLPVEIYPGTADEAGVFIALGRMANEVGRLVDDEQVGVLVDDGEQFFQTAGLNHGWTRMDTDKRKGNRQTWISRVLYVLDA